ncbi:MAG TPA: GNAT family N-acetyltransferase [Chloroflexota bacterium]|nr:GNAT family N-acetyltransferase [Chloroflexota bacterium]
MEWDSTFFGTQMGVLVRTAEPAGETPAERTASLHAALAAALDTARAGEYAHVIFRAPAADFEAIWAAEGAGLRLVDVGVDSTIDLEAAPGARWQALPGEGAVRPAREADLSGLQDLAAGAFVLSRFAADPFFSPSQVEAFHRAWVANLYRGLAQATLVREVDGQVAGFVTCALHGQEGRIPLIATGAGYRRRGLGRSLVEAALGWFAGAGARLVRVKTQAHNYAALALYHRAGFTVTQTELTFSAAPSGERRQP